MKNTVRIMYTIVFSLNFLTAIELTVARHLIVGAAKLNQHKKILTSKFGSNDMLPWKRGSSFVSTNDKKLWTPSRLMWFDQVRPLRVLHGNDDPDDSISRTASRKLTETM